MALKVVLAKAGEQVSEHSFGKEARARGITVGSADDNDIVVGDAAERHGRIARDEGGYFFIDQNSGHGFKVDGTPVESGGRAPVTLGTKLAIGEFEIEFQRGEPMRRAPVDPAATVQDESGGDTTLQQATFRMMSDISQHFLGEGNFGTLDEVERFGQLIKLSLEIAMEWMGQALRGREEFKDQFSAPLTELYTRSLNPVKAKGRDISQVANYLLDWREERDAEEIRASLQHAFQDMAKHQMGLLAGVQQFVSDLQQKLDPRQIEQDAGGGLFGGKKAWERYGELYSDTFAESSKLFNELIYPSIRKGYIFSHEDIGSDSKQNPGGG